MTPRGAASRDAEPTENSDRSASWANALWEQRQRYESLGDEVMRAKARRTELKARQLECQQENEKLAAQIAEEEENGKAEMLAWREQEDALNSKLEICLRDLAIEARKEMQMAAGLLAKESEHSRRQRHLEGLETEQTEKVAKAAARVRRLEAEQETRIEEEGKLEVRRQLLAQSGALSRKLHNEYLSLKGNIRVFCRLRPRLPSEQSDLVNIEVRSESMLTVSSGPRKNVTGMSEHASSWDFSFDHVFGMDAPQTEVFEEIALLVQSALDGYRVAIFAYGQTGSGKTYTMEGPQLDQRTAENAAELGVIPRTVDLIFQDLQELQEKGWSFDVFASALEVYNETVNDLFLSRPPNGRDGGASAGPHAVTNSHGSGEQLDFRKVRVESASAVHALLRRLARERHVGATACNARSSRSHAIFQLSFLGRCDSSGGRREVQGLLSLVDLAGSERVEKSGATGERLREAQHINRSLSALGDVVEALTRRRQNTTRSGTGVAGSAGTVCDCASGAGAAIHIPYRNSRLTMLLKDSLGGESKALMFVNVSPCMQHLGETLSSLRFAAKVHACEVGVATRRAVEEPRRRESSCRPASAR